MMMRSMAIAWVALGFALASAVLARAEEQDSTLPEDRLVDALTSELAKKYPGARIQLGPEVHWTRGRLGDDFQGISVRGETPRGELMFSTLGSSARDESVGWVAYSAWLPARFALKRVHPGDKLSADLFDIHEVNVATGPAHEYRGIVLDPRASVAGLEARQSVLEGQVLLSTSVQRVPDIRRGDAVRVHLISNGLSLSTQGVAQEPAFIDGQIRVMAGKNKRELVGKLMADGLVEVKL